MKLEIKKDELSAIFEVIYILERQGIIELQEDIIILKKEIGFESQNLSKKLGSTK